MTKPAPVSSISDARKNLYSVVQSILAGGRPSQKLLDEADRVLERIKCRDGSVCERPDD